MKRIISLLLIIMIISSMACSANAMHYSDNGNVTYNGTSMTQNFDSSIRKVAPDFQPGDSMTITMQLKNDSDVATDWYMKNTVLKVFEESAKNSNGSYSYSLAYNGTVVFSSDTIGGDNGAELNDATSQLNNFFFLGRIPAHGTSTVTLDFAIDGETQNNDYWNTISDLDMQFAVEKTTRGVLYIVPKTADKGTAIIWGTVTIVCLETALLLILTERKNRKAGSK